MKKNRSRSGRESLSLYGGILRPVKKLAILAMVSSALSGAAEALGLATLLPILSSGDASISRLWPFLVLLATFLIAATLLKLSADFYVAQTTTAVESRARRQLTRQLMESPWSRVGQLSQGDVTSAVMSEATQLSNGVSALLSGVGALSVVLILAVAAVVVTPGLFVITVIFALVSVSIFRRRLKSVRENEANISRATVEIGEEISAALGDIKYLRESGTDNYWLSQTERNTASLATGRRKQLLIPSVTRTYIDSAGAVFLAALIGISAFVNGDVTTGLVFVALFYRIVPRLQASQTQIGTAFGQLAWIERWNDRMRMLTVDCGAEDTPVIEEGGYSRKLPEAIDIQFDRVSHSYGAGQNQVLSEVSLQIPMGRRVSIVGPSGSGKTTMLDLLLGLFEPTSGQIRINGRCLESWEWRIYRSRIGLVSQDMPFRRGTIADNICWELPREDSWLQQVVDFAQLAPLLNELTDGVDTFIDSKSIGLSGGQRQRIALARALYRRPLLLVLDEATSALDSSTEGEILASILTLPWVMTTIFVTHRPAALKISDEIVRIRDGRATTESSMHVNSLNNELD